MLFENRFMTFIQNISQQQGSPPLHLLAPHATNLSSMGSMTGLGTWYPVDDITVDTPCYLYIPLSRVGNKTKEVAGDVGTCFPQQSHPGRISKILVREITDMGYIDYPLDHVTHEGFKELGQAIDHFILWNRREFSWMGRYPHRCSVYS
jgi:hypothetical protein